MPPLSVKDVERFTPDSYATEVDGVKSYKEGAPVYLMGAPGWRVKAKFNAQMVALNLSYPNNRRVSKVVLDLLQQIQLQPEVLIDLVAKVETFRNMDEGEAQEPLPENASDDDKAAHQQEADRRAAIATAYDEVAESLRGAPALDNLLAQRAEYNMSIPPIAAAFMLRGWENGPGDFRRVNDVVPDDVLDLLSQDDLMAIGKRALDSMFVTKAQKGN